MTPSVQDVPFAFMLLYFDLNKEPVSLTALQGSSAPLSPAHKFHLQGPVLASGPNG